MIVVRRHVRAISNPTGRMVLTCFLPSFIALKQNRQAIGLVAPVVSKCIGWKCQLGGRGQTSGTILEHMGTIQHKKNQLISERGNQLTLEPGN